MPRNLFRHHQTIDTTTMFYCDSCNFHCSKKDNLPRHKRRKHKCGQLVDTYVISTLKDRVKPLLNISAESESHTQAMSVDQWFEDIFIKDVTGEFLKCHKFWSHFLQITFPLKSNLQLLPGHRSTSQKPFNTGKV